MSKPIPVHVEMNQFEIKDHQVLVGGHALDSIADILGKDVFYAYDKKIVKIW